MSIVKTCYYCRRSGHWHELCGHTGVLTTINYFELIGWICEDCIAEKQALHWVPRARPSKPWREEDE